MKTKALIYSLRNPANLRIFLGLAVLAALSNEAFASMWSPLPWAIAALPAAAVLASSYVHYMAAARVSMLAGLTNYENAADTAEEAGRRRALVSSSDDYETALEITGASWESPRHNTNGALLLNGSGIDVCGQPLGASELTSPVQSMVTHDWSSPTDAYTSPHGKED